ncbi:transporter substrate-binding domain-containing protein [Mesobacterium sp. TK19101]|uniref:Transporter substrate-binding domain-containing protein n=1 Tax=Mesobacterium hydrothermale TaxID=3111907 RepID=A0ABU6HH48_9RHOB|nr:transporter substrate-binding domain-containing protein [Mesobacterium sp. TK19101]MEC3861742.1 transporter substrate-binding domain-containing protein [Mesobacterium sp. TK19101]
MKFLRNLAIAAVAALALTGPAPVQAQDTQQALSGDSVIETIKRRGVLKVGMATFVPWAMRDKDGNLIGFEIDVAKKVAEDMGVEVEFVPTAWDGIIPALISGKFDVIIGGMSVTPARNLTVNFTEPYAHSSVGTMANIGNSKDIVWPEGYNSTDVTFSCRRGATPCEYIKKHFPKATLRLFDDQNQVVQEVLNGNANIMLGSQPLPAFVIYDNPEVVFAATDTKIDPSDEAFALRKGDPDALNFFNNWIRLRTRDGWLEERHQYWFGGRPWADQVPD